MEEEFNLGRVETHGVQNYSGADSDGVASEFGEFGWVGDVVYIFCESLHDCFCVVRGDKSCLTVCVFVYSERD